MKLDSGSRNLTTFSTHLALARYKRLNFGCKSASEIFHETTRKKLIGVNGALNIHDDILIFGKNKEDHQKALKHVLDVLICCGLTANTSKCQIFKNSVKFYGMMFSNNIITPDTGKVIALENATTPSKKTRRRLHLKNAS